MIDDLQKKKDHGTARASDAWPRYLHAPRVLRSLRRAAAAIRAEIHHLCACGAPLLARYDLDAARAGWSRDSLAGARASMWRYRELMPLLDGDEAPVTLGEGWTPLDARAAARRRARPRPQLFVKDESLNPTNSFKARGLSAAVTRAFHLGAKALSIPTAGNAGNAMAAYAASAGLAAHVFMPRDVKTPFIRECELYGADGHARRRPHHRRRQDGRRARQGRTAGTTSPRSRSRTASKARRRWGTSWPSSSTGRCPTGSSIRPAAAPAWSACGRRSPRWRRSAGSTRSRGRTW